jgi:hydrogenase maturation protease
VRLGPRSSPSNIRLRVIGVGQEWRGDDTAGLLVARRLREMLAPQSAPASAWRQVQVLENSGFIGDLLAAWEGSDAVILVDAVRSGGRPGEIYRFPLHEGPLPAELFPAPSTHLWGVAQAVALAGVLKALPPYLVVYGLEGKDFGLGRPPSAEMGRAVPEVARRIILEIMEYLGQSTLDSRQEIG